MGFNIFDIIGLRDEGYNLKERAYVYGGAIAGAIAPVVGAKYLFLTDYSGEASIPELVGWGCAVIINLIPMLVAKFPIPVYTAIGGGVAGIQAAEKSRINRINKESSLENLSSSSQDGIDSVVSNI